MTRKLIAFALLMIPIAAYTDYHYQKSRFSSAPLPSNHLYIAGVCVRELDAESWENTFRIEMVGENKYLVRKIPESLYKESVGMTLPFETVDVYMKKVPCPTK